MAINLDTVAEKIMKFIRGNGLSVQMYDSESGKSVADPSRARFFYIDEPNMMIVLDDDEKTIKFHMGEDVSINNPTISKMSKNLKSMAVDHMLDFDIRSFGKRIQPKSYGYKIEQNKEQGVDEVFESISPLEGSTRTSRQKLENAKIIVRHKKPVSEEVRGARSRNISAIFIENADGERFKYPFKHLSGARAMARHISTGGNPMDMAGSAIVEMSENLSKLKEFMNIVNKQRLVNETNRDVVLNVKRKMKKIKEQISHIQGAKGYTAFIESLALNEKSEEQEISEDTINDYVSKFTKSTFEETLKDILPLVHKVNEEEYNSNRDGQIEKVMGIITAKDAEGNKINTISFPNKSSYDFDNIKKQYKDDKGSQYAKMAASFQDLASRVDVDSTDDKVRKNKGHDRAAIISLFLSDIAEKLDTNPKAITKPEQQLAGYFMKMSKRAVGESLEEKKSLDEKLDTMVMETFTEFNKVFEEYQIDELSPKTLTRYAKSSYDDYIKRSANREPGEDITAKMQSRMKYNQLAHRKGAYRDNTNKDTFTNTKEKLSDYKIVGTNGKYVLLQYKHDDNSYVLAVKWSKGLKAGLYGEPENDGRWYWEGDNGSMWSDSPEDALAMIGESLDEVGDDQIDERELTGGEKRSREANVKKLKKHKGDFEDTYGKDKGEQVMYAVATKRAKEKK